jgi:hypothetical protein
MDLEPAELSQAIRAVRSGLAAAQQEGDGLPIQFTVKDVVLDLGIELRRTESVGGGVKTFVVTDAKGERPEVAAHRMTITLQVASDEGAACSFSTREPAAAHGPTGSSPPTDEERVGTAHHHL